MIPELNPIPPLPPPRKNPDTEFRQLLQKAINSVPKVNSISSSKRMATDIGLFSSFHWIEPESALPPQEIFSLPDIKLTLGICQSHLKHYRVTDYSGAVFNHNACQREMPL